ncbi:MAG TPA: TetR/AcrR family transcriptional regulator [Acidimicrobiia bacterium]|nr:TetR/AcrR family transcriptional regulator [Acidimicrobiia bacterium]
MTPAGSAAPRPRRRPGRPAGKQPPGARRVEYLAAAMDAIRDLGPQATMGDIAERAGVSKPVLYDHFGDRLGLTVAVVAKLAQTVAGDAVGGLLAGGEPQALLARTFDVFVGLVEREPELYRWILRGAQDAPTSLGDLPLALEGGTRLAAVIGSALRSAGADSGPAEPWAFGIVGFVFAATEWWLVRRSMRREEFVDYLARFVWAGLAAGGVERIDVVNLIAALPTVVDTVSIAATHHTREEP